MGYKYGQSQPRTTPHADFAAVNVDFWITPDEANLDEGGGGLLLYDVEAPRDWDFESYNKAVQESEFLRAAGAQSIAIPYRSNPAVIFILIFPRNRTVRVSRGLGNGRITLRCCMETENPLEGAASLDRRGGGQPALSSKPSPG